MQTIIKIKDKVESSIKGWGEVTHVDTSHNYFFAKFPNEFNDNDCMVHRFLTDGRVHTTDLKPEIINHKSITTPYVNLTIDNRTLKAHINDKVFCERYGWGVIHTIFNTNTFEVDYDIAYVKYIENFDIAQKLTITAFKFSQMTIWSPAHKQINTQDYFYINIKNEIMLINNFFNVNTFNTLNKQGKIYKTRDEAERARADLTNIQIIQAYISEHEPEYRSLDMDKFSVLKYTKNSWSSLKVEYPAYRSTLFGVVLVPNTIVDKLVERLNNNEINVDMETQ